MPCSLGICVCISYIFPGIALAAVVTGASSIRDSDFSAAAQALAKQVHELNRRTEMARGDSTLHVVSYHILSLLISSCLVFIING